MRHSHPTAATWLSKQTMFLLIILFVAAAARFLLVLNLPILFFTYTIHDDTLFMRLATNLASGHWLGEYNQFTLMKGPGYPAFLAITSLSGLPLSIANALFQTVAISVAAWAAFRLSRLRVIAGLTFVALIFCPVGFVVQRVLRGEIYWAQTLLVFSLFAILFFTAWRGRSAAVVVAGLAGCILGWAWLTREEGIWFLPGLGLLAAGAILINRKERSELLALARNLCIATVGFLVVNAAFMTENLIAYGLFVGVDFKEHNFKSVLDALQNVDAGPIIPYVPVSRAVRSEVAKVSPTFAPLSVALAPGGPASGWSSAGCAIYEQTCGDIGGGWFMWALRDAAAMNGFYQSPKKAAEDFGKIANEIAAACSDGRLHCHRRWVSYVPRMTNQQWASLPRTLVAAAEMIANPPLLAAAASPFRSVKTEQFEQYWTFLNNPRVKAIDPNRQTTVVGWYYDSQSAQWPVFKAYAEIGQEIPLALTRQASPDLQRHFSDDRAGYNRFQMVFLCPNTCAIVALTPHRPELRLALDRDQGLSVASGSAQLYVDFVSEGAHATSFVNPAEKLAAHVRVGLIRLYRILQPMLLFAGLIAAVAASWRAVRRRALDATLLTALAAWALVATSMVILALIDIGSFPAVNIFYSAPASYAAILAACLSIAAFAAKWA